MQASSIGIDIGKLTEAGKHGMRYVQEKRGQKLHIAFVYSDGSVSRLALCGRSPAITWRISVNVPMGMCCRSCSRILKVRF